MKEKYHFKTIEYENGTSDLIIIMDEPSRFLIADFLTSDIQGGDFQYALDYIDAVLTDKEESIAFSGNSCYLEVRKEKTRIEALYPENEGEETWYDVDTKDLKELILIWTKEIKNFREKE